MSGERAHLAQFRNHDTGYAAFASAFGFANFPGACHSIAHVEAFDRIGEVAHKILPAQFTVGENLQAQFLLLGENAEDFAVLDLTETLRIFRRISPSL